MVVDGRYQFVGSNRKQAMSALKKGVSFPFISCAPGKLVEVMWDERPTPNVKQYGRISKSVRKTVDPPFIHPPGFWLK